MQIFSSRHLLNGGPVAHNLLWSCQRDNPHRYAQPNTDARQYLADKRASETNKLEELSVVPPQACPPMPIRLPLTPSSSYYLFDNNSSTADPCVSRIIFEFLILIAIIITKNLHSCCAQRSFDAALSARSHRTAMLRLQM